MMITTTIIICVHASSPRVRAKKLVLARPRATSLARLDSAAACVPGRLRVLPSLLFLLSSPSSPHAPWRLMHEADSSNEKLASFFFFLLFTLSHLKEEQEPWMIERGERYMHAR